MVKLNFVRSKCRERMHTHTNMGLLHETFMVLCDYPRIFEVYKIKYYWG